MGALDECGQCSGSEDGFPGQWRPVPSWSNTFNFQASDVEVDSMPSSAETHAVK